MKKKELYDKLKIEGVFWSYDWRNIEYIGDKLLIEHTLVWGDFPDIVQLFKIFETVLIRDVWNKRIVPDERYHKLNVYLAYIFFEIAEPKEYIEMNKLKYSRYEKIKSLR